MKKIILIIAVFFLLIFLAAGFFFFETSSGLTLLLKIASLYLPGELQVERLQGKLAGPLELQNLSYNNSSFTLSVRYLNLDWQLGDLLKRKWHIQKFVVDNVILKWRTAKQESSSQPLSPDDWNSQIQSWEKFFRHWRVQLDKVQVTHVAGISNGQKIFQLDHTTLNGYKRPDGFSIFSLKLMSADNVLEVQGKKQKAWNIRWKLHVPSLEQVAMSVHGSLSGQGHWSQSLTSYLEGKNFQWKDVHIGQFQHEFYWNPNLSKPLQNHLHVKEVQWPAIQVQPVSLNVSSTMALQYLDKKILVDGDVSISKSFFHSDSFEQTVTLPTEVEIIQERKTKKTFALAYEGKVHLKIGPEVHLELVGLRGDLVGDLTILLNRQQLPIADGTLSIQKGSYDFYGQTLQVKKGQLSFAHSLLTNPQLDIMAGRTVERPNEEPSIQKTQKLMVGVKVQGTAEDPQPKLFSDPAGLQEADILSYLLFGKSINEVAQDQSQLLLRAAQGLNVGGGGGIIQTISDIKHQLGLTELTVKTAPTAQGESSANASLVVGKYLTRKLYVSYSMGLTGASNLLKIRYLLSPRWSLEVQNSSEGNGTDLFYSVERD